MTHIVIGSIPRSGSTFFQTQLTAWAPGYTTGPETWYLQNATLEGHKYLTYSELGSNTARLAKKAYVEFGCDQAFDKGHIAGFVAFLEAMAKQNQSCFFVEKTPRNIFYLDALQSHAPQILLLQLVRKPYDVILSNLMTFSNGKSYYWRHYFDIVEGYRKLLENSDLGIETIKYEDVVRDEKYFPNFVTTKLNLQPEKLNNQNFPEDMVGSFGDPYSKSRIPFKKNRYNGIRLSKLTNKIILRFMMDISVQLTYNKFYNEDEYQIDLLKVKNNPTYFDPFSYFQSFQDTLMNRLQLNILLAKYKDKKFTTFIR